MTGSWVCVDANLVIKLVVEEAYSHEASALWRTWQSNNYKISAPPLLRYEIISVLRKHVTQGFRSLQESRQALQLALAFNIQYLEPFDFHLRAFELADRLGRPVAYDTHYLALAEHLGCEFWTADERLTNAVQITLPWVKWLGQTSEEYKADNTMIG
jgi:predicted nucleic acid-binding protein